MMLGPLNGFLKELEQERGLSANTLHAYRRDLKQYMTFLTDQEKCTDWPDVTEVAVAKYLYRLRDMGSASSTIARKISVVRGLHRYLLRHRYVKSDPAYTLETPVVLQKPPDILSSEQVERLLCTPDAEAESGIRDRAILELLYATGMRVTELVQLNMTDLNLDLGFVRCSGGKGRNERIIPLGTPSRKALAAYIQKVRHQAGTGQEDALFCNMRGGRLTRQGIWKILKNYAEKADIGFSMSPETLRHTLAAHMLENGADTLSVDELLGRESTGIIRRFPRLEKRHLKDVYARYHPRA